MSTLNFICKLCWFSCLIISVFSCTTPGPSGLFGKKSPHESYSDKITQAGLKETAIGRSWFSAAEQSLAKALSIPIPYSEAGYFAADKPEAVGVRFKAVRGQKLKIELSKKPATGFLIYMDLWEAPAENERPKLVESADTAKTSLELEVKREGFYIVRLQPELLASGEYNLSISAGPSLAFPVPARSNPKIQSFWGAARDAGVRKHEGIDIFAPFRTPLVAAANGTVNRVEENNLGGKVIFFRPYDKDYTLYYAHLDEQLVSEGQQLKTGDTLGLMGKTGNAASTSPHLHFGIYTFGGAVDPLPFVNPVEKKPAKITAPLSNVGKWVRSDRAVKVYGEPAATASDYINIDPSSLLRVQAATAGWYKVMLPDGTAGYITSNSVSSLNNPLRKIDFPAPQSLLDAPNKGAARKLTVEKGETVNVVATFKDFYYVSARDEEGWIPKAAVK